MLLERRCRGAVLSLLFNRTAGGPPGRGLNLQSSYVVCSMNSEKSECLFFFVVVATFTR